MKVDPVLFDVLDVLDRTYDEVEVFGKKGRSRTVRWTPHSLVTSLRQEEGWAVRAGDARRSFYHAETGSPRPEAAWPEADGKGLRLPSARPVPRWKAPSTLDAPLIGESEALGLFEGLAKELDHELPGARLLLGHLDDGSSESHLVSSREIAAINRHRLTALYLEAAGPEPGYPAVVLARAERDARRFNPKALARRLADRLLIETRTNAAPVRDRGEFILAPEVIASLLEALAPLWIGPDAEKRVRPFISRGGRLGSRALTLVDNGRLDDGVLSAATDGEGLPTREVHLVEGGIFRQPLLSWSQSRAQPNQASGCTLRPGWRDLPKPGPTHLYLQSDPSTGVAHLLEDLSRGYYLLAVEGAPKVDFEAGRFALPASGFAIDGGRATGSISKAWLLGSISTLLNGLLAPARDLTFVLRGSGMIGAPTVLVKGLELRQRL